jgi:hypothetical protein
LSFNVTTQAGLFPVEKQRVSQEISTWARVVLGLLSGLPAERVTPVSQEKSTHKKEMRGEEVRLI